MTNLKPRSLSHLNIGRVFEHIYLFPKHSHLLWVDCEEAFKIIHQTSKVLDGLFKISIPLHQTNKVLVFLTFLMFFGLWSITLCSWLISTKCFGLKSWRLQKNHSKKLFRTWHRVFGIIFIAHCYLGLTQESAEWLFCLFSLLSYCSSSYVGSLIS